MPTLPGVLSRPTSLGRRATAADFGGDVAAATGQATSALTALGQISSKIVDVRETARTARAVSEAEFALDDFSRQLKDVKDEDTHIDLLEKRRGEIAKEFSEPLTGPWRSNFEDRFREVGEKARLTTANSVRSIKIANSQTDYAEDARLDANKAAQLAGQAQIDRRESGMLRIQDAVEAGVFTEAQGLALRDKYDKELTAGDWKRGLNEDPITTLERLEDQDFPFNLMAPSDREQAIKQVTERIRRDAKFNSARAGAQAAADERARVARFRKTEQEVALGVGKGEMSVQDIEARAADLSPGMITTALKQVQNPEAAPGVIDKPLYASLKKMRVRQPGLFLKQTFDAEKLGLKAVNGFLDDQRKLAADLTSPVAGSDARIIKWLETLSLFSFTGEEGEMYRLAEQALQNTALDFGTKLNAAQQNSVLDNLELDRYSSTFDVFFLPDIFTTGGNIRDEVRELKIEGIQPFDLARVRRRLIKAGAEVSEENIVKEFNRIANLPVEIAGIPAPAVATLRAKLERAGVEVSEAAIRAEFNRMEAASEQRLGLGRQRP